jgi:cellulose biosynthesis protein BcsQ
VRTEVAPGVDLLPAHTSLEAVGVALASQGGLLSAVRRVLRPVRDDYDHVVLDTHGDLGNLTLSAVAAADSVLTVFTSDPGSALGAVRVAAFLEQHRRFENTDAVLVGVACSLWDKQGRAAREVAEALEGTELPLLETRIPLSRRVPSSTLEKRPVVPVRPQQHRRRGLPRPRRRAARLLRREGLPMTTPRNGKAPRRSPAADLSADLLADLTAPTPLPSAPPNPPASTVQTKGGTPALSVTVTPVALARPVAVEPRRGHRRGRARRAAARRGGLLTSG